MDTVLKVLKIPKTKTKLVQFEEVYTVFDQAIYCKTLEVIIRHLYEDLRSFCNIRMGLFHVMMVYIAVIGIRFTEADLTVEI